MSHEISPIYAIGDVHGRSDLLAKIISFIERNAQRSDRRPRVFFLGDLVDRGPDSCGVLRLASDTLQRWPGSRLILGNHDYMLRDALTERRHVFPWLQSGGVATLTFLCNVPAV